MIRSKTSVSVFVGVATAAMLAACGSSSASKPSSQGSTTSKSAGKTSAPKSLCTVITADDAATVFGEPAQATESSSAEPLVSAVCIYHHAGDALTVRNFLQVRIYPGEQFYGERVFPNRKSLTGIGEKAFEVVKNARHTVDVQFVKDGKTGTVNYSAGSAVDVESRVPDLVVIAKKLAASM